MSAADPPPEDVPLRQPLPPEQPPAPAVPEQSGPTPASEAGEDQEAEPVEWWRAAPEQDPPGPGALPGSLPVGPGEGEGGDVGGPGGLGVGDELRQTWATDGREGAAAAQELGYQLQHAAGIVSDAVASAAYPAASRRGLDIRWMRLSVNLPAIAFALLVTWGGRSATDRMLATVVEDGPFAPHGWVLLVAMVLGVVMVVPMATPPACSSVRNSTGTRRTVATPHPGLPGFQRKPTPHTGAVLDGHD